MLFFGLMRLLESLLGENMKVEIENGRLIVTPITREEERIVFAMAAAFAAFEAVAYPITGEAVRCNEDDSTQSDSSHRRQDREE